MRDCLTIVIGGEAGQGLATVGEVAARLLSRAGYNFITYQGYHSRIRGGHNTYALKISQHEVSGPEEGADLVISLDEQTDIIDGPRLRPDGLLFAVKAESAQKSKEAGILEVPYAKLGTAREANMVALGLLVAATDLFFDKALEEVKRFFGSRAGAQESLAALQRGYEWAVTKVGGRYQVLPARPDEAPRLIMNGNEALALGAAAGGVNFCSFYPMSPATTVAINLSDWAARADLLVEQAEDEIAAVNMALGASYTGAVPLVTTSGGGFALMTEGVSLAGMIETPLVMVLAQRPGPATGLPTRTEQGDLNLVLYAGHGEFPRAILAPSTITDCALLAARAVWLAEESQGPVFVLTDQYLSDCTSPIEPFDLAGFETPVNPLDSHKRNAAKLAPGEVYLRYDDRVKDGRSPRLLPGFSEHLVKVDSDEHSADGHITEDLRWRVTQQNKRMKKLDWLRDRALSPEYHGDDTAGLVLLTWGSTLGAGLDAVAELKKKGTAAGLLHFKQLYPLNPADWLPRLEKARVVVVEGNYEGQFAQLLRREGCCQPHQLITRYDGLPLTASYILERLEV